MNRNPEPVDLVVGQRIRQMRWMRKVTQQDLAEAVGCKFQQVQKYETGANRVSASRLAKIAAYLDTPINFFFGETGDETLPTLSREEIKMIGEIRNLSEKKRQAVLGLIADLK